MRNENEIEEIGMILTICSDARENVSWINHRSTVL